MHPDGTWQPRRADYGVEIYYCETCGKRKW